MITDIDIIDANDHPVLDPLDAALAEEIEAAVARYSNSRWLARRIIETTIAEGRPLAEAVVLLDNFPLLRLPLAAPPPITPISARTDAASMLAPIPPTRRRRGRNRVKT